MYSSILHLHRRCACGERLLSTIRNKGPVESAVSKLLRSVIEPVTGSKLNSIGCIEQLQVDDEGKVKLNLNLLVPGYTQFAELESRCRNALSSISEVKGLRLHVRDVEGSVRSTTSSESGLQQVCHVIGVSSCKGGVGKSTVAVNLACALAQRGLSVGILDADIYGPSLPTILQSEETVVRRSVTNPKFVLPLKVKGVPTLKMLSFGHVNPKAGAPGAGGKEAAVMRGPLVSKVLNQLLLATDWGKLDYLVIDMPPGTGDIQITLTQSVQMSGAVVVTTPHRLALVDAAKGVAMFDQVNVPVISVVENMAHFTCRHGEKYYPFGKGGKENLVAELTRVESTNDNDDNASLVPRHQWPYHQIPLTMASAGLQTTDELQEQQGVIFADPNNTSTNHKECNEEKFQTTLEYTDLPAVLASPRSDTAKVYHTLARSVIDELFRQQTEASLIPAVVTEKDGKGLRLRYFGNSDAAEYLIPAVALKSVEVSTGNPRENMKIPEGLSINRMELKGLYGVGITWSDGQVDIYRYEVLKGVAQDFKVTR